ncbi:hypothetical protein [uncultured Dialister sp.]|uniref:hypothetical protein n=1 Tax=uncultured Dialister sp. TaxID=278064 RepID=UPI0025D9A87D|nr:hypothetical protein [uncultured Dialister sp.]
MKKVILALLSALALSMSLTAGAADFIRLDGASYDTMWQKGKTIKKHGSLENPMHYGVEMRHGTLGSNQVVLVTPYTAGLYISSTENLRLLDVPADFKDSLLQNQDILFIAPAYVPVHHLISWSMETKGSGRAEHLALVKDGKRIYPRYTVNPAVDSLLPHSHFVRYFGFTRQEILDVPYEVRYVNGEGDLISFKVDEKDLEELIREEKNFKA